MRKPQSSQSRQQYKLIIVGLCIVGLIACYFVTPGSHSSKGSKATAVGAKAVLLGSKEEGGLSQYRGHIPGAVSSQAGNSWGRVAEQFNKLQAGSPSSYDATTLQAYRGKVAGSDSTSMGQANSQESATTLSKGDIRHPEHLDLLLEQQSHQEEHKEGMKAAMMQGHADDSVRIH